MPQKNADEIRLERLVFFSDAVIAIAITLLALEIRLPELPEAYNDRQLADAYLGLLPQFFSFFMSFMVIGLFWIGHHRIFGYIQGLNRNLIWINLFFLMFIALLPFASASLGHYGNHQLPVILYAANVICIALLRSLLWYSAVRSGMTSASLKNKAVIRQEMLPGILTIVVFLISIAISFFNTSASTLFLLILLPASLMLRYAR